MTIQEHVEGFDLDKLTYSQRETLHYVRTLATWLYLVKYREQERRKDDTPSA